MASKASPDELGSSYKRFKPHLLMVVAQLGYTLLYFITEASFNHGMNPHVYITYRTILSSFVMLPFAYFLEREMRPKLTLALFAEIFVLSLLGVSVTLNMYFASLRYTSPSFISSMINTIASLTFVIAVVLRMETLDIKSTRGVAKVLGTVVSLAGVTIMTLYKGPVMKNLWPAIIHIQGKSMVHEKWLKGSILTVCSCITWSMWYIMQRKYKSIKQSTCVNITGNHIKEISSTTFTDNMDELHRRCTISGLHSMQWAIGMNIDLWSTIYGAVVCSGLIVFIQLWCTNQKGPVFVTMFNPLSTVQVAVLAFFIFGEKLYTGSIIGGTIVIIGLYVVLWGKEGDPELATDSKAQSTVNGSANDSEAQSSVNTEEQKEGKIQLTP